MKRSALAVASVFSAILFSGIAASPCRAIELVHYTFDQVDGTGPFTTPDSSGRGNTGTLTSMDTGSPVPGRVGNALQFSNTGTSAATRDRVEIVTPAPNPDPIPSDLNRTYTQFTFAAFVKPVGIAADEADTTWIAGKLGTGSTRGWQIGLTGTDPPTLAHPDEIVVSMFEGPSTLDNDNEFYSGPQTAVVNDQWAHLAFTFSSITETSSFFRMYLNGIKVVDTTTDLLQMNGVNTRAFQVGNRGDNLRDSWNGLIDDVRLFDHALTDAEIAALIPPLPPAQLGDFNQNGKVDGADYALWRKNVDGVTALPNDNGLGTPISTAHYDLWRANFGNPPGSGAGSTFASAVPEPTSGLMMLAVAAVALCGCRHRTAICASRVRDAARECKCDCAQR